MMIKQGPVLCVDDEPSNLALMRQVLQGHYKLAFARSGREAVEAALKLQPSMVLMDVDMPDMDGLTAAKMIKDSHHGDAIPIIFVTSRSTELDEEAGFEAGGVDYITKPISPAILKARVKAHLSLVRSTALEASYRSAIYMLGEAGHFNDTDTGFHIWRMASYSRVLAVAAAWSTEEAALLEMAAPMHDMGKIGVPDAILKKPGPLTDEEWVLMREHTTIGHDILNKGEAHVFKLAAEVALNHHERWDGTGYPAKRAGKDIPESARIVAIADVFDALTMKRSYKEAWSVEQAMDEVLRSAGRHFDPGLVELFQKSLDRILLEKERWDDSLPDTQHRNIVTDQQFIEALRQTAMSAP